MLPLIDMYVSICMCCVCTWIVYAQDFADYTLPEFAHLCANARGGPLLVLTGAAQMLIGVVPPAAVVTVLIPLLARAADQNSA